MAENQTQAAAEIRASNAAIRAATDKTLKGIGEVKGKIAALEELIAQGGPITQELKDAVAELAGSTTAAGTAAQELDDVVPDAPIS